MKLLKPWSSLKEDYSHRYDTTNIMRAFVIRVPAFVPFVWSVQTVSGLKTIWKRGPGSSMEEAQDIADELLEANGWKFLDERLATLI